MSQQAAHKLCQWIRKYRNIVRIWSQCTQSAKKNVLTTEKLKHTIMCFFFYFLSLNWVKRLLDVCESAIKMQPMSYLQCRKVLLWSIIQISERAYLFSDCLFGFEAWQVKYSASMVKGAGIAVWLVINNCLVTAFFKTTSSPKSSNSTEGLSSTGVQLNANNSGHILSGNVSACVIDLTTLMLWSQGSYKVVRY